MSDNITEDLQDRVLAAIDIGFYGLSQMDKDAVIKQMLRVLCGSSYEYTVAMYEHREKGDRFEV